MNEPTRTLSPCRISLSPHAIFKFHISPYSFLRIYSASCQFSSISPPYYHLPSLPLHFLPCHVIPLVLPSIPVPHSCYPLPDDPLYSPGTAVRSDFPPQLRSLYLHHIHTVFLLSQSPLATLFPPLLPTFPLVPTPLNISLILSHSHGFPQIINRNAVRSGSPRTPRVIRRTESINRFDRMGR